MSMLMLVLMLMLMLIRLRKINADAILDKTLQEPHFRNPWANTMWSRLRHESHEQRSVLAVSATSLVDAPLVVLILNASRRPPRPGCGALFRKAATRKPTKAHRPETRNSKPQTLKKKP